MLIVIVGLSTSGAKVKLTIITVFDEKNLGNANFQCGNSWIINFLKFFGIF